MSPSRRLEPKLRFWAYAGAVAMLASTLLCLGILLAFWRGQVHKVQDELEGYTREEALAVARLLLYDLAADPRVVQIHTIENDLGTLGAPEARGKAPGLSQALVDLVSRNLDWPDTEIWESARRAGLSVKLEDVTEARRSIYERAMEDLQNAVQEDLWARVTFSEHLRGVRLVTRGRLATLQAGEEIPGGGRPAAGTAITDLSAERLLVTLPLYVHSSRWGTAYLLMDRSFLTRVSTGLKGTVDAGLWVLGGLLMLLLLMWAWWWIALLRGLRRDVVAPVVNLSQRMEGWAQPQAAQRVDLSEPQELAEAFERLLVRVSEQQEQLLRAQRMGLLERIGAGLSHELNNALNPARLRLEELEMANRPPDASDVSALKEYLGSAQRILKDLSLASRQPSGDPVSLAPKDWLHVARRLVEPAYVGGPSLDFAVDPDGPPVMGHQQALVQVAVNLLLNAREAVEALGPEGAVCVTLERQGEAVAFTVADNGAGIPPEVSAHLFEPFVTSKARGSGLGLFVVDALLRRMGGRAVLETREGGGTLARVTLQGAGPSAGGRDGER